MPTTLAALAAGTVVAALSWPSGAAHAAAVGGAPTANHPRPTMAALACEISEFPPKDLQHLPEISCR